MAAINRDPEVTRWLNRPTDDQAGDAFYRAVTDRWATHGFGLYAVEALHGRDVERFLGFVGIWAARTPPTRRRVCL